MGTLTPGRKFSFQVKAAYSEPAIEELLNILEEFGGEYWKQGEGAWVLNVPAHLSWTPFFLTLRDCDSIHLVKTDLVADFGLLGPGSR